jgi:hypothetical protein
VPLNIAEGAGEYSVKDKARFYRMAKRSTTRWGRPRKPRFRGLGALQAPGRTRRAAVIEVCACLVDQERLATGRGLLLGIVSMLVRMVNRTGLSGTGTARARARNLTGIAPWSAPRTWGWTNLRQAP